MATIDEYREMIQMVLQSYSEIRGSNEDVEAQLIFDQERDRYQLVHVGWSNKRRVYGCVVQMDLQHGKIWIQHDGTDIGIANELLNRGIPKSDIVLAFQSPFKRQFTEFTVG